MEALALQIYHWRHHLYDVDPYWVTGERAAAILGVHISRLNRLVANDAAEADRSDRSTWTPSSTTSLDLTDPVPSRAKPAASAARRQS